jgi:hypothetical protein
MHLDQYARITGPDRAVVAADAAAKYEDGKSIRAIAKDLGRSFGFVHTLLQEQGIQMRSRGGNHARPPQTLE